VNRRWTLHIENSVVQIKDEKLLPRARRIHDNHVVLKDIEGGVRVGGLL
jgi:hypothetical protein